MWIFVFILYMLDAIYYSIIIGITSNIKRTLFVNIKYIYLSL